MFQVFNQQVQQSMTPENFAYWLQGFFEITGGDVKSLTPEQIQMIKTHLGYVFNRPISIQTPAPQWTTPIITTSQDTTITQARQPSAKSLFETLAAVDLSQLATIC